MTERRETDQSFAEGERIAKYLASAGVASRRDVEKMIAEGRISVDGKKLDTPAFKVTGREKILLDGQPVSRPEMTRLWRYHKPAGLDNLAYREVAVEALAQDAPGTFDVVTCMEMLEHVPDPGSVVRACATLVRPGGWVFFSTINRNAKAFLLAIVGAEHVLGLLAAPLAANVPLAALAGILAFVAWNMGEWREFGRLRRFTLQYRTILLGTFLMTVIFDLTVAVQVGLILA